jgi:hypothetical protein
MKNSSQLLKFSEACMRLATQQVPLFSCKFSKHTFTQPQLVVLYCLKIKLGVTYRELGDRSFLLLCRPALSKSLRAKGRSAPFIFMVPHYSECGLGREPAPPHFLAARRFGSEHCRSWTLSAGLSLAWGA